MMFHFKSFASMFSAVTMAATSAPTHASESRHLIDDTKNDGGPMVATGDRNPFVPSKIAESYDPQLDVDQKDMNLSLHPRPIFPWKEEKVQVGTLRNKPETTSDGKSDRNQTANTSTPFDPSLDLGILDGNRIPNDRSIQPRKLDDLDCNGYHPLIPAEVDFADLIGECKYYLSYFFSCPYELPIGCWNTSLVTDMSDAFYNFLVFNEDISAWETSSVTNMARMFGKVYAFNQPINSWDVSSVTDMYAMFLRAYEFNQPVDSWNVSSVLYMSGMFRFAYEFNQPIDSWDVSSVTSMSRMFYTAKDFNQCLSTWADKAPPAVYTVSMFYDSGCSNLDDIDLFASVDPDGPWCQGSDVCINCENQLKPFETSCTEIATLPPKTIKDLCAIGFDKRCPELCPGNESCPCTDNLLPFSLTSCAEVAGLKEKKQIKKCNKKKIADNCPGVCTCGTF